MIVERIKNWRLRRQEKSLERWAHIRSKGKARFITRSALSFSLSMIVVTSLADYIFDSELYLDDLIYKSIYYVAAGVLLGLMGWWTMEGRYLNAKLDARIKAGMRN